MDSFVRLKFYCEREQYKGWDPYDGLNSKVFHALPFLDRSALCRLIVIQGFKRNPLNLRRIAGVPKECNPKGIGLFLQGYCNLVKLIRIDPEKISVLGAENELIDRVRSLAELLIGMKSKGDYHGACWGYNFDWQARRLFLFPKFTPTVVVTCFCATALMDAYEITNERRYLEVAISSADFVAKDLHRYVYEDGILLSYSTLHGNDTVFNASMLGCRLLSRCYGYTGNDDYKALAEELLKACCSGQREDGAWIYGLLPIQNWVDSFHTGYILDGLAAYEEETGDMKYHERLEKGFDYYVTHFFESDGSPRYYDNRRYPIDIHCPGQLMVTLSRLHKYEEFGSLAEKVLGWTVKNMQNKKEGYYYYQLKKGISSKISYMRWSNAFMFYSISYYLLESRKKKLRNEEKMT